MPDGRRRPLETEVQFKLRVTVATLADTVSYVSLLWLAQFAALGPRTMSMTVPGQAELRVAVS